MRDTSDDEVKEAMEELAECLRKAEHLHAVSEASVVLANSILKTHEEDRLEEAIAAVIEASNSLKIRNDTALITFASAVSQILVVPDDEAPPDEFAVEVRLAAFMRILAKFSHIALQTVQGVGREGQALN